LIQARNQRVVAGAQCTLTSEFQFQVVSTVLFLDNYVEETRH